jgi:thiopurine S-methyltransferase
MLARFAASTMPTGARVLVPLSGKAFDLVHLAGLGHEVLGIELSEPAVRQFFAENPGLGQPKEHSLGGAQALSAGGITLVVANVFDTSTAGLGSFGAVYDRAALVALNPDDRARYGAWMASMLSADATGLLVTFHYDQSRMAGPPFAIGDAEVTQALGPHFAFSKLAEEPTPQSERAKAAGVVAVEMAYRLERKSG